MKGLDIPPGSLSYTFNDDVFDSDEIRIIRNYQLFKHELKSRALPPIMACFNTTKISAVGKKFLEKQKAMFEQMVLSATLIVIIGVQVRNHDEHIWKPLSRTNAKLIYCSGNASAAFSDWCAEHRAKKMNQIYQGYFGEHINDICGVVRSSLGVCI